MKLALAVALGVASISAAAHEVTGSLRQGIYDDSDQTTVYRTLAFVDAAWTEWHLFAKESVDIISSASVDVRTSPLIDATSGASRVEMGDTRFETTIGTSHDDGHGHIFGFAGVFALESEYQSYGGSVSGSYDLDGRTTTFIGSVAFNHNIVGSHFDGRLAASLESVSYTAGLVQVVTASDVLRLRYDGQTMSGYQASPYRSVRFGNWSTTDMPDGQTVFSDTIGDPKGLPEKVPDLRVRHAAVVEWVHGLTDDLAVLALVRLSDDSWNIRSGTFGLDLRYAHGDWLLHGAYRFYLQGGADFFQDKYVNDPSSYVNYTSDKELGDERGHIGSFDVSYAFHAFPSEKTKTWLDLQLELLHYAYPGFVLLESRTSFFGALGLRVGY